MAPATILDLQAATTSLSEPASVRRRPPARAAPKGTKPVPSWVRVHQWAIEVLGETAGRALAGVFLPSNRTKLDRGMSRAVVNALLPKDRPVRLPVPDIDGPESQSAATKVVYEALRDGQISPPEALQWFDAIERRYQSWIRFRTSPPIREQETIQARG